MILKDNVVESASDARRIRSAIVNEIGAVPHALTKAIWRVPVTSIQKLDMTRCKIFPEFLHKVERTKHNRLPFDVVVSHIERAQEMMFFFKCLSEVYEKDMNGANTTMPLHWDGLSPADVAMQILVKHGFTSDSWLANRDAALNLMRKWQGAPDILVV